MESCIKAKTSTLILLVLLPSVTSSSRERIGKDIPRPGKMLDDHHQPFKHFNYSSDQVSCFNRSTFGFRRKAFYVRFNLHSDSRSTHWAHFFQSPRASKMSGTALSMGFLIPVGILTIRLSNREERGRRVRIMFFIHAVTQVLSVILVTAGAILSVKNFSNTFDNTHRRIGVALYGLVFLQALSGVLRPARGSTTRRSVWFFAHWVLGTTVSLLGIINIYTGMQAYHKRMSRSIKPWVIFYTLEIVCIGFLYLFQEKWEYIQKQGVSRGNEPTTTIQPTDNQEALPKPNKDSC